MVRQIASHSPAHQKPPAKPLASCISSAAAFAPLATAGPQYGIRDVAKPKNPIVSATAAKPVPSTVVAYEALERGAKSPDVPASRRTNTASEYVNCHVGNEEEVHVNVAPNANPCSRHHLSSPMAAATNKPPLTRVDDAFNDFHVNRSGFLDRHELDSALFTTGINTMSTSAGDFPPMYGDDPDGKVGFRSFNQFVSGLTGEDMQGVPMAGSEISRAYMDAPTRVHNLEVPPSNETHFPFREPFDDRYRERAEDDVHLQAEESRVAKREHLISCTRTPAMPQDSMLRPLVELEALPPLLGTNQFAPVRLVRAEFLIDLWQRGEVLLSRQVPGDCPDAQGQCLAFAMLDSAKAARLLKPREMQWSEGMRPTVMSSFSSKGDA